MPMCTYFGNACVALRRPPSTALEVRMSGLVFDRTSRLGGRVLPNDLRILAVVRLEFAAERNCGFPLA